MPHFVPAPPKLTRVTEAKCLRHLALTGFAILLCVGYGADTIWRHQYPFAAASLAGIIHLWERFCYWLSYKRALRSFDPRVLPQLRGVRIISFEQELVAGNPAEAHAVAIEASPRPSRTFAVLLTLIDAFVVACCALCIYVWRLHFPWASLTALAVALVSILLVALLWSNVLDRTSSPVS